MGPIMTKVVPPKPLNTFFQTYERYRLNEIQRYKQIVANRQQLSETFGTLAGELVNLALQYGPLAPHTDKWKRIRADIDKLETMEEKMTELIDSFVVEHGYFLPRG